MSIQFGKKLGRNHGNSVLVPTILTLCTFLLSVSHPAHAAQHKISCTTEVQLEEYLTNMWGEGSSQSQQNLVDCLQSYWFYKKNEEVQDAQFRLEPSRFMISALQFNPVGFFKLMDSREKFYEEWVSGLSADAFTWHRDPPCAQAAQMWQMKLLLKANESNLRDSKTYKNFMKVFMPMGCRQID